MTLKERAHQLVDTFPDDSPRLREVCEQLALDKAIDEAMEDVRAGRVYPAEEVIGELQQRWAKRRVAAP